LAIKSKKGFTIAEVMVSSFIVALLFLAISTSFSTSLLSSSKSKIMTEASVFLETVMENLAAQGYDNLLAMNGNRFFDNANANAANYAVDLIVFSADISLLQMRASLIDLRTNQELAAIVTHRSTR